MTIIWLDGKILSSQMVIKNRDYRPLSEEDEMERKEKGVMLKSLNDLDRIDWRWLALSGNVAWDPDRDFPAATDQRNELEKFIRSSKPSAE